MTFFQKADIISWGINEMSVGIHRDRTQINSLFNLWFCSQVSFRGCSQQLNSVPAPSSPRRAFFSDWRYYALCCPLQKHSTCGKIRNWAGVKMRKLENYSLIRVSVVTHRFQYFLFFCSTVLGFLPVGEFLLAFLPFIFAQQSCSYRLFVL